MSAASRRRKRAARDADDAINDYLGWGRYAHAPTVDAICRLDCLALGPYEGVLCPILQEKLPQTMLKPRRWHALAFLQALLCCDEEAPPHACPNHWQGLEFLSQKAEIVSKKPGGRAVARYLKRLDELIQAPGTYADFQTYLQDRVRDRIDTQIYENLSRYPPV